MQLSIREKKRFRTIGHQLNPVVTIAGRGLEDGVLAELERALSDHELIKIKLTAPDRQSRQQLMDAIKDRTGAISIQVVGNKALIYRAASKPKPHLSNILRSNIF